LTQGNEKGVVACVRREGDSVSYLEHRKSRTGYALVTGVTELKKCEPVARVKQDKCPGRSSFLIFDDPEG